MTGENVRMLNMDCLQGMKDIPDASIDVVCTDPPYLYLKGQKLEREFDEQLFFSECKRVLKETGFVVLFGRGTSFYRWNTILDSLGFLFKEEIIWDKSYCSSPLMAISRVHETISVFAKCKGKINKVKVPYLETKAHDISSIITDIKRLKTTFKNTKSLDAVLHFLQTNELLSDGTRKNLSTSVSSRIEAKDRCASVMKALQQGMQEKTIVRNDFIKTNTLSKHNVTCTTKSAGDRDRGVKVMNSVSNGMNEKSVIKSIRDHYSAIHPTQKPVRLLERLLALVSKPGDTVLDAFAGSFSCAEACINTDRRFIGFEIDKEYFEAGKKRIESLSEQIQTNEKVS